ncbi:hypothetical protein [Lactococcus lactis]|uniref:hypothetical protein n=1 Tax=Lactococcus lactis TaxID=1358 RepID=UPI0024A82DEC|nr:hypothetical protein [Lactococcus lactis]
MIAYGTEKNYKNKIEKDISDCLNKNKINIPKNKIKKIVICHTSTNITIEENERFLEMGKGVEVELIGLNTIAQDLSGIRFQDLAREFLDVEFDSGQIFTIENFINNNDKSGTASPLNIEFKFRKNELLEIEQLVSDNTAVLLSGASGVGKTRIALEICGEFERLGYQILCVKNNGQFLFDDVRIATSDPGKYLLFLDDINRSADIQAIVGYVHQTQGENEIKILATVRDYERGKISGYLKELEKFREKNLTSFSDEEIRKILKESLKIKSSKLSERIVEVVKGNVRLAVLAGKLSVDNRATLVDASNIFANYYGEILNEQKIDEKTLKCLFIVALLKTVRVGDNDFAKMLLDEFSISWGEFREISQTLHYDEWVDYYLEEIVKINDQSFGDYILEYGLIERKYISVYRLLELGFPENKKNIVSGINTILRLFYSYKTRDYIKEQVIERWNKAEGENEQEAYLEVFGQFNLDKSLLILSEKIDALPHDDLEITEKIFQTSKNNERIDSKTIGILSGLRETEYFEEVIELLIKVLEVQSSLFMEIYFAIKGFIYDENSHNYDYKKELLLIEKIWDLRKSAKNKNLDFLFFKILPELLKCSGNIFHMSWDSHSFKSGYFTLGLTDGIMELRKRIWQMLAEIENENKIYRSQVYSLLMEYHWNGFNNQINEIFQLDMNEIKENFVQYWEPLSFEQSLILRKLSGYSKQLDVPIDEIFDKFKRHEDYKYLEILSPREKGESYSEFQQKLPTKITDLTTKFILEDYKRLILIAKKLESNFDNTTLWQSGENLSQAFQLIPEDLLSDVLEFYFSNGAPYSQQLSWVVINKLNGKFGFEKTYELISQKEFPRQDYWKVNFWQILPEEKVNEKHAKMFYDFMKIQFSNRALFSAQLNVVLKFAKFIPEIIDEICEKLLDSGKNNNKIIYSFLIEYHQNAQELIEIFSEKLNLLEELYLAAEGTDLDYDGELLIALIETDETFWDKYTKSIDTKNLFDFDKKQIFPKIWLRDDYKKLIDIAYDNIVLASLGYFGIYETEFLFPAGIIGDGETNERSKTWILNYIDENANNMDLMYKLFLVVGNQNDSARAEYIIEFLKKNKSFVDFKEINLFPTTESWSGSEVPRIDHKIIFLQNILKNETLKGLDFICHRDYLNQLLRFKTKQKKDIQIREYQDDFFN